MVLNYISSPPPQCGTILTGINSLAVKVKYSLVGQKVGLVISTRLVMLLPVDGLCETDWIV